MIPLFVSELHFISHLLSGLFSTLYRPAFHHLSTYPIFRYFKYLYHPFRSPASLSSIPSFHLPLLSLFLSFLYFFPISRPPGSSPFNVPLFLLSFLDFPISSLMVPTLFSSSSYHSCLLSPSLVASAPFAITFQPLLSCFCLLSRGSTPFLVLLLNPPLSPDSQPFFPFFPPLSFGLYPILSWLNHPSLPVPLLFPLRFYVSFPCSPLLSSCPNPSFSLICFFPLFSYLLFVACPSLFLMSLTRFSLIPFYPILFRYSALLFEFLFRFFSFASRTLSF